MNVMKQQQAILRKVCIGTAMLFAILAMHNISVADTGQADDLYIRTFSAEGYNASSQNWAVIQDKRGVMYFGNTDGILEFNGISWRLMKLPDGKGVFCFAQDSEKKIFAGGDGEIGFLAPDALGTMEYISLLDRIPDAYKPFEDRIVQVSIEGETVIFQSDKRLYILKPDTSQIIGSDDHFFSSGYLNGEFFVIDGLNGLMKLENGVLNTVPGGELLRAYVMLELKENRALLITPHQELIQFNPAATENPFSRCETPAAEFFRSNRISCAARLTEGDLAFGTIKNGLLILDEDLKVVHHLTRSDGLASNDIYGMNSDKDGNIWLGSNEGITFINLGDESRLLDLTPGAESGELAVQPEDTSITHKFSAIITRIEGVDIDSLIFGGAFYKTVHGETVLQQTEVLSLEFPFDFNAFRFAFSSNYYREIEKIEYQFFLEGLDREWSRWTNRTEKDYTNLHWGKYTFHVKARNVNGEISQEATYTFSISPPWYETLWYYSSQVGILFSLLVIAALLNRSGKGTKLSNNLINIVALVIFSYINVAIEPLIGMYSSGIALFEVLLTILVGVLLDPTQELFSKSMLKVTGRKISRPDSAI